MSSWGARRETTPLHRKILSGVMVLAGVVLMLVGVVVTEGPASVNLLTVGMGLVVCGTVIWFQHGR